MKKQAIWYKEFSVYHPRKKNLTMWKAIVVTPINKKERNKND